MKRLLEFSAEITGCHECFFQKKELVSKNILSCFCGHPKFFGGTSFTIYTEVAKKVFHKDCPLTLIREI